MITRIFPIHTYIYNFDLLGNSLSILAKLLLDKYNIKIYKTIHKNLVKVLMQTYILFINVFLFN